MKKYLLVALVSIFIESFNTTLLFGSTISTDAILLMANNKLSTKSGTSFTDEIMATKAQPKLVLIGIVYDKISHSPLANSIVELVDQSNKQKSRYTTNADGHFYFKLSVDKNYVLYTFNARGDVEDQKTISTINKSETEILHAVLEGSRSDVPATLSYTEKPSPITASPNKDVSSELIFKVQVGAFKEKLNGQSSFIKGLGNAKIQTEEATNGYYRYLIGDFKRLEDAQELERSLKQDGYTKSFIVPYLKGERLKSTPEEAQQKYGK